MFLINSFVTLTVMILTFVPVSVILAKGDVPGLDLGSNSYHKSVPTGRRKKALGKGLIGLVCAFLIAALSPAGLKVAFGRQIVPMTKTVETAIAESIIVANEAPHKEIAVFISHPDGEFPQPLDADCHASFDSLRAGRNVNGWVHSFFIYAKFASTKIGTKAPMNYPGNIFCRQMADIPKSDICCKLFATDKSFYSERINADVSALNDFSFFRLISDPLPRNNAQANSSESQNAGKNVQCRDTKYQIILSPGTYGFLIGFFGCALVMLPLLWFLR